MVAVGKNPNRLYMQDSPVFHSNKKYVVSDSFHEGRTTKGGNKAVFSYHPDPSACIPLPKSSDVGSYSNFSLSMTRESTKAPKTFCSHSFISAHYNEGTRSFISFLAHLLVSSPLSKDVQILKGQK